MQNNVNYLQKRGCQHQLISILESDSTPVRILDLGILFGGGSFQEVQLYKILLLYGVKVRAGNKRKTAVSSSHTIFIILLHLPAISMHDYW